jgi:hypothetical protein
MHVQTADLFGTPSRSPGTDRLFEASIQWATRIICKVDEHWREGDSEYSALPRDNGSLIPVP